MLEIVYTTQFKKDYKRAQKRGIDVEELFKVIDMLQKSVANEILAESISLFRQSFQNSQYFLQRIRRYGIE